MYVIYQISHSRDLEKRDKIIIIIIILLFLLNQTLYTAAANIILENKCNETTYYRRNYIKRKKLEKTKYILKVSCHHGLLDSIGKGS